MIPARYVFAVLGSVGFAIIYGLKVNLSVAIVAMVNHTALARSGGRGDSAVAATPVNSTAALAYADTCAQDPGSPSESLEDGPFEWSETTQGYILASYFWGYLVTQLPGGRMAELLSAKWVMFAAVLVNAVCTLLTPPAAALHAGALLAMRVGEGLGAGLTFPAMHVMISKWAPPDERSVLSSVIYAGTALGTVVSMLLSGLLAGALGWASVFYVMGGLSLVWCVLWVALVADSPALQRGISAAEREYIEQALGHAPGQHTARQEASPAVPWKSVWTSGPFWAILIAHICSNFGWYMLLIELPTYMRYILKFSIKENAGLSALPFLLMWFFSMILGRLWEYAKKKNYLTTSSSRKISTLIASIIPALCLIGVSFVGCNRPVVVMLMSVAVMSVGGMFSGYLSNHIDIAPNFSGTLMAITNTFATIPGFVVPVFVGKMTDGNQTISAWRTVFLTTVVLFICEAAAYVSLGSGEEQKWNNIKKSEEQLKEERKNNEND